MAFLFALSMEYLSRCLGELKNNPDFNFHSKCERLHLTHLMFADDQFLFGRADDSLVIKVIQAFMKFCKASWLHASLEKSSIYVSGVNDDEAHALPASCHMTLGLLPFKYLGIPLS